LELQLSLLLALKTWMQTCKTFYFGNANEFDSLLSRGLLLQKHF